MTLEDLSSIAARETEIALRGLPREVRRRLENVPVFFERRPDPQDLALGVEEDTLGYYDPGSSDVPTPRIRLWLENLWDYAEGDARIFREEVQTTLLHEIGHALGWDEEELDERGLG